jgi:3-oxoadipate enol-lactonase
VWRDVRPPDDWEPAAHWRASGRGPALVLLNGWSASGLIWPRTWVRELQRSFRVIRVDNRGSGWSRHAPTPFTLADLADDVVDVLDDADVDCAVVFGLSMGGMIAQELAIRAPQRVAGLVLAATAPPTPAYRPASGGLAALVLFRPPSPGEPLDRYLRRVWSAAVARGFAGSHPEVVDELVEQIVARPTPRSLLIHQLRAVLGWGHAERLASITAPTAVVHGRDDRLIDVSAGRRLAELIPDCRYEELAGVVHLLAHEAPGTVRRLIDEVDAARGAPGRAA